LDRLLENISREAGLRPGEMVLVALRDDRLGHSLALAAAHACPVPSERIAEAFNQRVLPFERIRACYGVPAIPVSALGKILREALSRQIEEQVHQNVNPVEKAGTAVPSGVA
jgi:acyl-coenzyme A synthetase/AMP-(fatty) acid ligase